MITNLRHAQGWALAVALATLPFELVQGVPLGPITLTNVELLLLAAVGLWLAGCALERRLPAVPRWLSLGGGALVGALLISAALAPEWRAEALKFALRQGQGLLLACCVADLLRRDGEGRRQRAEGERQEGEPSLAPTDTIRQPSSTPPEPALARRLGWALLAGAALSALLGLWEMSESPAALAFLAPFKTESTFVGGLLRLSATFSYANTAAQYFEALLPLAILLPLFTIRRKTLWDNKNPSEASVRTQRAAPLRYHRYLRTLGHGLITPTLLLSALLLLATLFTYSRAALLVCGALLVLTPLAAWWQTSPPSVARRPSSRGAQVEAPLEVGPKTEDQGPNTRRWSLVLGRWSGPVPIVRSGGRAATDLQPVALISLALAALIGGVALISPEFRLRLVEPEVARWFGARYEAGPLGTLAPNAIYTVPVAVENSGRIAWEPEGLRPIRLSYHWLDAETRQVVRFNGRRTVLPRPIAPGERVTLQATLQAPERPGRYILAWDMLREYIGRGWFSQMGVAPAEVPVEVAGATPPSAPAPPSAEPPTMPRTLGAQPGPPPRRALWGVALALWAERPLLGIGPDVFRRVYGPRLGMELWDDRVHTNNLYLELLVGAGLLGLGALGGLMIGVGRAVLKAKGNRQKGTDQSQAGGQPEVERMSQGRPSDAGPTTNRITPVPRTTPSRRWPLVVGRWAIADQDAETDATGAERWLLLGAALGLGGALIHGMLDVFLAFTPTYALLWALVGAVAGLEPMRGQAKRASAPHARSS